MVVPVPPAVSDRTDGWVRPDQTATTTTPSTTRTETTITRVAWALLCTPT